MDRMSATDATPPTVGATLLSARSAHEYLAMFDLDLGELRNRRVLDCPAGAASFTAACAKGGVDAVAVDSAYVQPHTALVDHARAETGRGNAYVRAHAEHYVWRFFSDADEHDRSRLAAVEQFAGDLAAAPQRYVAGSLPTLPFADRDFDLALSSHLLFTYDDRLDAAFHLAASRELLRVSEEVRIFPLLGVTGRRSDFVPEVVRAIQDDGFEVVIGQVDYEFQRGGNEMLLARR